MSDDDWKIQSKRWQVVFQAQVDNGQPSSSYKNVAHISSIVVVALATDYMYTHLIPSADVSSLDSHKLIL